MKSADRCFHRCHLWLLLLLLLLALPGAASRAQTNPVPDNLISPEVLADGRVTFRVRAGAATNVSLLGDWMDQTKPERLTPGPAGVWSLTVGPLDTGASIYVFNIDGVTGPDPVNPRIKLRARTSASVVEVPGQPPELWEARDVPHGTVEINWAASQVTGDTRAYYVYTPPGYAAHPEAKYPVLCLLHGNNDTAAGWTDIGRANFILDNLIAEHRAVPMVIVMPWGHALPYTGPQSNNTALVERYLLMEVLPQVMAKYRVLADREHRAIVGLSMGGGHALQIGLSHLDQFAAVAAFSSAVPGQFSERFQDLLAHPESVNERLHLLWIGCGRQDPAFSRNEDLARLLTDHRIRTTFQAMPGRHNYAVWRRCLAQVAPLLFQPATGRP